MTPLRPVSLTPTCEPSRLRRSGEGKGAASFVQEGAGQA